MKGEISATSQNKEQRKHSSSLIPYSIYECDIPDSFPNVPMHWHNEFEIDYILQGNGDFICGDEHFSVSQGDVILLPPNMLHAAYPSVDQSLRYTAFVFHANMLGLETNDRCTNRCILPLATGQLRIHLKYDRNQADYETIRSLTEAILTCADKNNQYDDLLLKSDLFRLFWYFEKSENISSSQNDNISYTTLIRPALEHITYYYMDEITIEELAARCAISPSHFMSTFKKAVGCSAIDFLNHLRIKAACTELMQTADDISSISFRCGFGNLSNFNRQFKKITGCSPRDYRKCPF